MIRILSSIKKQYTDIEVVTGMQGKDGAVERWFYETARKYFDGCFNEVFFDKDHQQEIFQCAFIKLWTEIENARIKVVDGRVCRQQRNGVYEPMSCSLNTFLIAFARTEYRELVRNVRESYYDEFYDSADNSELFVAVFDSDSEIEEQKVRIVDECIQQLSPSCVEILTLFYYKGMSLDEIMEARGECNSSKNGLKTAKNKCLNTLKARVGDEFMRSNLYM